MVMRMDLIPETEQLHILKLGFMGLPYSRVIDIKNLEKIDFTLDDSYAYRWIKSSIWAPRENRQLVYRNIDTREIFTFAHRGTWNKEGLEHELLN